MDRKLEDRLDALAGNHTLKMDEMQLVADATSLKVSSIEKRLSHFIKMAVRLSKTLPNQIKSLKQKLDQL